MTDLSPTISIILNVNSLNTPIIRQRLTKYILTHDLTICCLQQTLFKHNIGRLKVKGWKKMYHTNINQYKARIAILKSCKETSEQRKL